MKAKASDDIKWFELIRIQIEKCSIEIIGYFDSNNSNIKIGKNVENTVLLFNDFLKNIQYNQELELFIDNVKIVNFCNPKLIDKNLIHIENSNKKK